MGRARKEPEGEPTAAADDAADAPVEEEPAAPEEPSAETPVEELPAGEAAPAPRKRAPAKKAAPKAKAEAPAKKAPAARKRPSRQRKPIVRTARPERSRGKPKERRGTVVSSAMDKTIVIRVDTIRPHPEYKKVVRRSRKFHAHDEGNEAKVGDIVRIVETRPLSKTKTWRLVEILEVAK
jgi:small subunit ribosomal protein S17